MTEFPPVDLGLVVPVFNLEDDPIACLNNAMAFLIVVASLRFPSTNNQLRTSSNPRNHATIQDDRVIMQQVQGRSRFFLDGQAVQTTISNTATFQTEDLDAYDSDCDDFSYTKAVLMANLSSYGSNVLSEVPHFETSHNDIGKANQEKNNESVTAELERYKERVKTFEQRLNVDLSTRENLIDSQMDDMIKEKLALNPVFDDEETLILEEVSRSKMLAKQNDPISKEKKVNTTQINDAELNRLSEDFSKGFVPQQELYDE
ncbi:hypothetical protein Tco_0280659 [Tanacetum coccineum]